MCTSIIFCKRCHTVESGGGCFLARIYRIFTFQPSGLAARILLLGLPGVLLGLLVGYPAVAVTPTPAVIDSIQFEGGHIVGLSAGPNGEVVVYDRDPSNTWLRSTLRFLQPEMVDGKIQISELNDTVSLAGKSPGFKGWMVRDGGLLYVLAHNNETNSLNVNWAAMWLQVIAGHQILNSINYNSTDQVQGDTPGGAPEDFWYMVNGLTLKPANSEKGNAARLIIDDTVKGNLDILDLGPGGAFLVDQQRYSYRERLEDGCQWPDTHSGPWWECHPLGALSGNGLAMDWTFETRVLDSEPSLHDRDEIYLLDPNYSKVHLKRFSVAHQGDVFWTRKEQEIYMGDWGNGWILQNGVESLHPAPERDRLRIATGLQSFNEGAVPVVDTLHRTGQVLDPVFADQSLLILDPSDPDHWFIPVADGFASKPTLILREVRNNVVVRSIAVLSDYQDYSLYSATFDPVFGLIYLAIDETVYVVSAAAPGDNDHDGTPDYLDDDDDNDGMSDEWEIEYGLDPTDAGDADEDIDGDGFTNLEEYFGNSSPRLSGSQPWGDCGYQSGAFIRNTTFDSYKYCSSGSFIFVGPNVAVNGGALTLKAPWVRFRPVFSVAAGSQLRVTH